MIARESVFTYLSYHLLVVQFCSLNANSIALEVKCFLNKYCMIECLGRLNWDGGGKNFSFYSHWFLLGLRFLLIISVGPHGSGSMMGGSLCSYGALWARWLRHLFGALFGVGAYGDIEAGGFEEEELHRKTLCSVLQELYVAPYYLGLVSAERSLMRTVSEHLLV